MMKKLYSQNNLSKLSAVYSMLRRVTLLNRPSITCLIIANEISQSMTVLRYRHALRGDAVSISSVIYSLALLETAFIILVP